MSYSNCCIESDFSLRPPSHQEMFSSLHVHEKLYCWNLPLSINVPRFPSRVSRFPCMSLGIALEERLQFLVFRRSP